VRPWYEELFGNYARTYDREVFTKGTVQEVDFIEAELGGDRSVTILDVGCGTGRHAIELARRGFSVTGIDLSENQLTRAREKAIEAGVAVDFLRRDARSFRFDVPFGAAIMICEGAFPLMETDAENAAILASVSQALRPGGRLVFTTLNALFPLHRSIQAFTNADAVGVVTAESRFDLMTFREHAVVTVTDDSGVEKSVRTDERFYAPSEITWLLQTHGFASVEIFGCQVGAFTRAKPLTPDDFEMLVVAARAATREA